MDYRAKLVSYEGAQQRKISQMIGREGVLVELQTGSHIILCWAAVTADAEVYALKTSRVTEVTNEPDDIYRYTTRRSTYCFQFIAEAGKAERKQTLMLALDKKK